MTARSALHEATYLPEAYKIYSAEARSDPQASLTRQRLDFLAFAPERGTNEGAKAKKDKGAAMRKKEEQQKT